MISVHLLPEVIVNKCSTVICFTYLDVSNVSYSGKNDNTVSSTPNNPSDTANMTAMAVIVLQVEFVICGFSLEYGGQYPEQITCSPLAIANPSNIQFLFSTRERNIFDSTAEEIPASNVS